MKKLNLRKETLAELSADQMAAVVGAATSTCSMQCQDSVHLDCPDNFTHACTALSIKLCVTGIG